MKTLALVFCAPVFLSFRPVALESTCSGCVDRSQPPTIADLAVSGCVTCFTTARIVPYSGQCLPSTGSGCPTSPCTPYIEINNHCAESNGGSVSGTVGGTSFGPLSFDSGNDTNVYRGWTEVGCGSSSSYEFTVDSGCGGTRVEYVSGTMSCDACTTSSASGFRPIVTPHGSN